MQISMWLDYYFGDIWLAKSMSNEQADDPADMQTRKL